MTKRATILQLDALQPRGVFAAAVRFARSHAVLVVSAVAALATVPFVPPDAAYLGYFDLKTLACLFGILALVGALRNVGLFESAARAAVSRFATRRSAVGALVAATLVLSMVATNDMALIMMLPLSAATLLKAGWDDTLPFAFVMQSLAANLGGMILPFGNPQNLYLFERYAIPFNEFLATMALPFAVSVLLIALCCIVFVKPDLACAPTPHENEPALEPSGAAARKGRAFVYLVLLAVVIAAVFRLVPYVAALALVVATLAVLDRQALRATDFGLLLTFACFFVFAGNMARIPAVGEFFSHLMGQSALFVSAGASQIISNVPAAVLLSHFTTDFHALLVGVNIGGAGTLVASLASLITFNQYRAVRASFPRRPLLARQTTRGFLAKFTIFNVAFLVILLATCLAFC